MNFNYFRMYEITKIEYHLFCLFLACSVYAVFGSPTPSTLGYVEILIGALLFSAIGFGKLNKALMLSQKKVFTFIAQIFLFYGLSVSFLVALINGHGVNEIIRDVIPFLFLFLPLFFNHLISDGKKEFNITLFAIVVIGITFSFRSLFFVQHGALLYLENMPCVLFAALVLIGFALERISQQINVKNSAFFIVLLAISVIPISAMASVNQRASLGAVAIYILALILFLFIKKPFRVSTISIIVLSIAVAFGVSLNEIWNALSQKNEAVGFNMRPQEMVAVWKIVTSDILTFFFGIGWGGHFHSPAVGGVSVNFTHNFFSSILLKTGFIGLFLASAYVLCLLQKLSQIILKIPALGIAIAAPVLIDLTLYASFKSLDFGLMLLMILWAGVYLKNSSNESKISEIAERRCVDQLSFS